MSKKPTATGPRGTPKENKTWKEHTGSSMRSGPGPMVPDRKQPPPLMPKEPRRYEPNMPENRDDDTGDMQE